jgi:hypothetical protein
MSQPAFADTTEAGILGSVVAQAKPIGQQEAPLSQPSLPKGLSYTLDAAMTFPLGNNGSDGKLPGSWDGVLGYGFNRFVRAQVGYYQLSEYPIGFSTGTVPVYLQGTSSPIGRQALSSIDGTVKNQILVAALQLLVPIGHKAAIVISPTYVARWGTVGGKSDDTLVMNPATGFPEMVHLRTFQYEAVAFTLPLVSSPRFFVTYSLVPQWLVRTNGFNQSNHPQLFQLGYAEYRATKTTTVFVQPSLLQNYTPIDPYPEHIPTFIIGATQRLKGPFYAQVQLSTGTPTNPQDKQVGVTSLTCQQLPCSPSQTAPSIAGLKATQVQLMLGVGTPSVIPL